MTDNKLRCVVTGLGTINAIGHNVDETFSNAVKSVSGIAKTTSLDTNECYADLAAEVKNFDLNSVPNTEGFDRVSKFAIKAATEALTDAGLKDFENSTRVSVIMGSCVGGAVSIAHYYENNHDKDDILRMPISRIANDVAGYFHAGGVVTNIANACAAGTISISYACDLIREGKADVVIAGGTDAFASVPYAGFLALKALDANGCSPFNHCHGITLGEGSGIVIVESYEHAKARGAKMYCEVLGAGVSSDAHHITAPREDGEGQIYAIRKGLANSGLTEADIDYINAHGTGTAKNDNAEFLSLHTIFDEKNDHLSVSSTKAMVGHCLGAAGAIEAVFSIKSLTTNTLLPTLGYSEEDKEALKEKAGKIDFIPNESREKELTNVISNSFAFGGNNASINFSKNPSNVKFDYKNESVAVTGLGLVTVLGNGVENYVSKINDFEIDSTSVNSSVTTEDYDKEGLKMSFYRKLDNLSQLQAVSGMQALHDAKYEITDLDVAQHTGIVEGTALGALGTCLLFEEVLAEKGNKAGSAFKFPNTVYNAAGGYLSICSGIKGYNVTVTNGAQSGLQSIKYAKSVLNTNDCNAVLATGTDENIEIIHTIYDQMGMISNKVNKPFTSGNGIALSDGSISVLLERNEKAEARGAKVYAHVIGAGEAHKNVKAGTLKGSEDALQEAIELALKDANITKEQVSCIFGFANGNLETDDVELHGLYKAFGENLKNIPSIELAGSIGEARSAGATLAVAHASLMLSGDIKSFKGYNLDSLKQVEVESKNLENVLVVSYSLGGSFTAVVLSK